MTPADGGAQILPRTHMAVLDFILNCAGLLLWLNWRSRGLAAMPRPPGVAIVSTLKRAGTAPRDRWSSLLLLAGLLFLRSIIYWQIGPAVQWSPRISLGAFVLHFRSDVFTRMLLYSLTGFLFYLLVFYFSLLLLAAVNRMAGPADRWAVLVRAHLGVLARLPPWLMLLLPFLAGFTLWLGLGPMFEGLGVIAPTRSIRHLIEQAVVIGLGGWLLWQYIIVLVLMLHLVASYVYLGNAPIWTYVNTVAAGWLRPLRVLPLRLGRFDLAPLLALAGVILIAMLVPEKLAWLFSKLPV